MNKLGFFPARSLSVFSPPRLRRYWHWSACCSGVFAVLVTPREEEPQINVTFANVFIPFPGASAREVESLIASPAEQVLDEIEGIERVYSTSMPGMAILTVQYLVGEDRTDAIVRLYSKIMSNPGLVTRWHRCRYADRQAKGYRRCTDRDRHPVVDRRFTGDLRASRVARHRIGTQAGARYP